MLGAVLLSFLLDVMLPPSESLLCFASRSVTVQGSSQFTVLNAPRISCDMVCHIYIRKILKIGKKQLC